MSFLAVASTPLLRAVGIDYDVDVPNVGSGVCEVDMKLQYEHRVEAPLDAVFRFHADPANLALLLARWPTFRLLRHDGHVRPGAATWFQETVAGCIPVVMGFRHTIYEPPHRQAEEMFHGPFQCFVHTHEFAAHGGATLVRDLLEVRIPWYLGGEPVMRGVLARAFDRCFRFRGRELQRLAVEGRLAPRALAAEEHG